MARMALANAILTNATDESRDADTLRALWMKALALKYRPDRPERKP